MYDKIKLFLFFVITIFFLPLQVEGQCAIENPVTITDDNTTFIKLVVDGAVENDLSAPDQGVCGVEIRFRHDFVGDLFMKLISPDGQEVTLVGPGVASSGFTQFTVWDIVFLPCGTPVVPDAGFTDQWDNLQPWGNFGSYSGSYYPHSGCLEDFDSGSVNGTWTLEIEDVSQFGTGDILEFSLIFCDTTGVVCDLCEPFPAVFEGEVLSFCENDSLLNLDIEPVYTTMPDSSLYLYEYAVFSGDTLLFSLERELDFVDYEAGTYTICPVALRDIDTLSQIPIGTMLEVNEINQYYNDNQLCGAGVIDTNCITLNIIPRPDTTYFTEQICRGDTLFYEGTAYFTSGTYDLVYMQAFCDSVSVLNLEVIDIAPQIHADTTILSCSLTEITLSELNTVLPGDSIYWYTVLGNIISSTEEDSIIIDTPGKYYMVVERENCIDTASVSITFADVFPTLELAASMINCRQDTSFLTIGSESVITDAIWEGPDVVNEINGQYTTLTPGVYFVTVTSENECTNSGAVEVMIDTFLYDGLFTVDDLSCLNDSVQIDTFFGNPVNYTFGWSGPGIFNDSIPNPFVTTPGLYEVTVTGENHCTRVAEIEVFDITSYPDITLSADTLTCEIQSVEIMTTSSIADVSYHWTGPDMQEYFEANPDVELAGMYNLSVLTAEGCQKDTFITIETDTISPSIQSVTGGIFICGVDSIQIDVMASNDVVSYEWTGNNFSSNVRNPFVFDSGIYIVEVRSENGCSAIDSVLVTKDLDVPDVQFEVLHINCERDTALIIPNTTSGYSFLWTGSGIVDDQLPTGEIVTAGRYDLIVTDNISLCTSKYEFEIVADTAQLSISLSSEIMDCVTDSVQITLEVNDSFESVNWSDEDGFFSDDPSPFISEPGWYNVNITGNNKCVTRDSIEIAIDTIRPQLGIDGGVINCMTDSVMLSFTSDLNLVSFEWTGPDIDNAQESDPVVYLPGMYSFIGTALNGCNDTVEYEVLADTLGVDLDIQLDGPISCLKPFAELIAVTDETVIDFEWTGPDGIIPGNTDMIQVNDSAMYYLEVVDTSFCVSIDSIFVSSEVSFPEYDVSFDTITCTQIFANINLDIFDPVDSVKWIGPNTFEAETEDIMVSDPGEYIFVIAGSNGCFSMDTVTILIDTITPEFVPVVSNVIDCNNEEVILSVDLLNDQTAQWYDGNMLLSNTSTITVQNAGMYSVIVSNSNGCTSEQEVEVLSDTEPIEIDAVGNTINCDSMNVQISVEVEEDFAGIIWLGPEIIAPNTLTANVATSGQYIVEVTGLNGCIALDTAFVNIDLVEPIFEISNTTGLPCNDSGIVLEGLSNNANLIYEWSGPDSFFETGDSIRVFVPGEYISMGINPENGCESTDTIFLDYDTIPPTYNLIGNVLTCTDDSVQIVVQNLGPNAGFYWSGPGSFDIFSQAPYVAEVGIYDFIVTNTSFCTSSSSVEVTSDMDLPELMISTDEILICDINEITLNTSVLPDISQYMFSWSTDDGQIIGSVTGDTLNIGSPGTYVCEVLNTLNQCRNRDTIIVTEEAPEDFTPDLDIRPPSCINDNDGMISVEGVTGNYPPFSYSFEGQAFVSNAVFDNLVSGQYMITIKDSLGCLKDTLVTLEDGAHIDLKLYGDTLVRKGDSTNITSVISVPPETIKSVFWDPIEDISCPSCLNNRVAPCQNTIYTLYVETTAGCVDSASVLIRVTGFPDPVVANIFNPESNSGNETFYFPSRSGIQEVLSLSIYDRWGNLMFSRNEITPGDPAQGWDGMFFGQPVTPGVYVFVAKIRFTDDEERVVSGDITVIR